MTTTQTQVHQMVTHKEVDDAEGATLKTLWAMVFDGKRKYPKDSASKIRQGIKAELRRLAAPDESASPAVEKKARRGRGGDAAAAQVAAATPLAAGSALQLVNGTRFAVRASRDQHYVVDASGEEVVGPYDDLAAAAAAARDLQLREAAPAPTKAVAPAPTKAPSTAEYIRREIMAGAKTPTQIAEEVRAGFSNSKCTAKDVYWHAWKMRGDGEKVPPWPVAPRAPKAEAHGAARVGGTS